MSISIKKALLLSGLLAFAHSASAFFCPSNNYNSRPMYMVPPGYAPQPQQSYNNYQRINPAPQHAQTATATAGEKQVVSITANALSQPELVIKAGQTVTWVNQDRMPHTIMSLDNGGTSGELYPGMAIDKTFEQPGRYAYASGVRPNLRGVIVVTQ